MSLFKKKIAQSPHCPICQNEPETLEHLFLLCPWTQPLWFGLQILHVPSNLGLTTIHGWILNALNSYSHLNQNLEAWIFISLWQIWKSRNELCFKGNPLHPSSTLHKIKAQCHEFIRENSPNTNPETLNPTPRPRIPPGDQESLQGNWIRKPPDCLRSVITKDLQRALQ